MDFLNTHLLSLILFFPALAAVVMLFLPKDETKLLRWFALGASLIPFAVSLIVWLRFNADSTGFQFEEQYTWYAAINSSLHLGVDGLSLTMVLLTTLLTPLAILASFSVSDRVKPYMMLFLFLETGMLGVFMAMDLLIFFVFWEVGLVPMYFLIAQWGSANKDYASLKFMIYTMGGSLGLLLGIQLLGSLFGTFDLATITANWTSAQGSLLGFPIETVKSAVFWAFVIAFAIKVPIWPFHTWLPDAHTEAPTAGSMILAGVLLKLGAYGFLRLVLPLYPVEAHNYAGALALLATATIVFGAFGSFGQTDFKRLVAYSSVNHMGFVVLGIAAAAYAAGTNDAHIALNGAILQM
ncbi:MAG: NADH-quinone oxidoreductase subunit M, partial [Chloroflexi bacterium]|nr:NADH-quinone oxidoreductase subunit M [Chloroflexota bacterium]